MADIAALTLLLAVVSFYTQGVSGLSKYFPAWLIGAHRLLPAIWFLVFFAGKTILAYLTYSLQSRFVYQTASRISRNELLRYLNSEYKEYVEVDGAAQQHRIAHQPVEFAHYILSGIQQMLTEAVLIIIATTAILIYKPRLFMVLAVFLLPAILLSAFLTRKRLKSARAHVQSDAELAMQHLRESLTGFVESRIYQKQSFFTDRYYRHQNKLNVHLADLQIIQWIPQRLVEIFAVCGLFLLILMNLYYGTAVDTISIGAFIAAAYRIIPGIGRIANLSAQMRTYAYTLSGLSKADYTTAPEAGQALPAIGRIAFRNVSFIYGNSAVLRKFNMQLERGDYVCISARSGKGKTTILNLLMGFLAPAEGDILINSQATDTEERSGWQRRIAYVKQQNFVIHDAIWRNITLSEDAADPARLQNAIAMAGLQPFIDSFPEGMEKRISDGGRNISGGQRQRIAIARALYKDSDVIILDEPFNELDKASEAALLAHLKTLADSGKIVLLVSHSSTAADWCNKKLQIDE